MRDLRFQINDLRLLSRRSRNSQRRGNTIILVIGILVLLVIIGTGYITRTQAARSTSTAIANSGLAQDVVKVLADQLSDEIKDHLFVRPIMPDLDGAGNAILGNVHDSNSRRLPIPADAVRYGYDNLFPYNRAPFEVVAFTNWPDHHDATPYTTTSTVPMHRGFPMGNLPNTPIGTFWPLGPGRSLTTPALPSTQSAHVQIALAGESNPVGFPGFGDTRWLRDNEPQRWWSGTSANVPPQILSAFPFENGPDIFTHWRHMTNFSRAENSMRVIADISNVDDSIVWDLRIPLEQWLTYLPSNVSTLTGGSDLRYYNNWGSIDSAPGAPPPASWQTVAQNFMMHWRNWMQVDAVSQRYEYLYSALNLSSSAVAGPNFPGEAIAPGTVPAPGNLYCLRDLDCNNIFPAIGQRPADEFIFGTPRHTVGRVLVDTDGDGFTDAFWHTAPVPIENGIRTIFAVSVVDNCGMINFNTATVSRRTTDAQKTMGFTPSDIALVARPAFAPTAPNYKHDVGFLNAEAHQYPPFGAGAFHPAETYNSGLAWQRHCDEVNLLNASGVVTLFPNSLERLAYWRRAASQPLSVDPTSRYTPFTLSDEIELRMYHGNNTPWVLSRLEQSTGEYFHTPTNQEESSELLGQRFNRQLVFDKRRMSTVYNSVRNDIMPPWLWLFPRTVPRLPNDPPPIGDLNDDGVVGDAIDEEIFTRGTLKFDLRTPHIAGVNNLMGDFNDDGFFELGEATNKNFGIAIRDRLERVFIDIAHDWTATNDNPDAGTYYGEGAANLTRSRELCAAFAANIAQRADINNQNVNTSGSALEDAVPQRKRPELKYMGLTRQPFLVEVFIGHIYKGVLVPDENSAGVPYLNAGHYVLRGDATPDSYSTVIAVQIANPFERPINLEDYRISVFGQELNIQSLNLQNAWLAPATHDRPVTAVFYAIRDSVDGGTEIHDKWVDFFDITVPPTLAGTNTTHDLPYGSIVHRVQGTWSTTSRTIYDEGSTATPPVTAVELLRRENTSSGDIWVVVDRIDPPNNQQFRNEVEEMGNNKPGSISESPADYPITPPGGLYGELEPDPVFDLGEENDFWVQWVRATRAWGIDVDGNGTYDPAERSPRFVIGYSAVVKPNMGVIYGGNAYKHANEPDPDLASSSPQQSRWFNAGYVRQSPQGQNQTVRRKPTFFDMNRQTDPADLDPADGIPPIARSYPDKGWYGQSGGPTAPVITNNVAQYLYPNSMQMLAKDDDYEQVGELLNTWLFGHRILAPGGTLYERTLTTFSEMMQVPTWVGKGDAFVNRLRPGATDNALNAVIGIAIVGFGSDSHLGQPRSTAAARLLDAFVCDGPGRRSTNDSEAPRLAKGFDGSGTPGMPNINTAPPEVLRALPHWHRIVHETGVGKAMNLTNGNELLNIPLYTALNFGDMLAQPLLTNGTANNERAPRVMIPEALFQFRERYNGFPPGPTPPTAPPTGLIYGPNFTSRLAGFGRGFSSVGELSYLMGMGQVPTANGNYYNIGSPDPGNPNPDPNAGNGHDRIFDQQWRIDLGVHRPLPFSTAFDNKPFLGREGYSKVPTTAADNVQVSLQLSTDRTRAFDPWDGGSPQSSNSSIIAAITDPGDQAWRDDVVAGDAEEANLLLAGASNLVTTRSDTFTVYFKVRRFRQNTSVNPPVWDATDPEYIVEDSRYVMLIDRSNVNRPSDKARILYLEKLPN